MTHPSEDDTLPPRHSDPHPPAPERVSATSGVRVDVAGLSDRGRVRPVNEDHFFIARAERSSTTLATSLPAGEVPERTEETGYVMMVADGMGGHAAGELASRTAIGMLVQLLIEQPDWIMRVNEQSATETLKRAEARYKELALALTRRAEEDPALRGMGTTMTVAYSLGLDLFIAHVGDSRAYLVREGVMSQLTRDHTHVQNLVGLGVLSREEAATHRLRNVLTNVLGAGRAWVEVELHRVRLLAGDRLLLCTDGLTAVVKDDEIAGLLGDAGSADETCRRLVELALQRGAPDNVTVIASRYDQRDH